MRILYVRPDVLQSPQGDSVHCNIKESVVIQIHFPVELQSPEGDSVHCNPTPDFWATHLALSG